MKKITIALLFVFTFFSFTKAQQLVYRPINPAFGGNSYNYSWLLSSANAQNQFDDEDGLSGRSSLNSFTESINRQLISRITNNLFGDTFGEGDLAPGTYTFGSLYIEISNTTGGLLINILDTETGEQTEILIPE